MRFHLPTLPGRPTTRDNSTCAYSGYVRKFARMMVDAGHEVIVYGDGPDTNGCAGEFVPTYKGNATARDFLAEEWKQSNRRAVVEIAERCEPGDILGIIGGQAQALVAESLPELRAVEYRVGYGGTCTTRRVFETYAWMHTVYGAQSGGNAHAADGQPEDAVIPPPFEVEDFPEPDPLDETYLLYVGRLIERKGVGIAVDVAKRAGLPLFLAGEGDYRPGEGDPGIHYIGHADPETRGVLMSQAHALLCPTTYVEPGGGVAIEAQLCGTPVLSTDWGCFTETVEQGLSGYRCRSLPEFEWAVTAVASLDRDRIRRRAIDLYSLPVVGAAYGEYFDHLAGVLQDEGFHAEGQRPPFSPGIVTPA